MFATGQFKNLGLDNEADIQSALLIAMARSAEDLTNGKGWPDGVDELLESLGRVTGVSRVWIFQTLKLTDTYIIQDYTFEWASKEKYAQIGLPAFNLFETKINQPDYKKMIKSRVNGDFQKIIVNELEQSYNRTNLEAQGIKSMLTIPIFVENKWWGTLGFDDCERELNWTDSQIALLRTAGFLLSSAILKDRLDSKRKQLDILQQMTEYSAWEFDLDRRYLWFTSEILNRASKKSDNLRFSLKSMLKIIHPNDRSRLSSTIKKYIKHKAGKFRCDIQVLTNKNSYSWVELIGTIDNKSKHKHNKLIGIAIDITERKKLEKELEKVATTDPLTNILNRRGLEQIIKKQFTSNHKAKDIYSFLMLDIDFFKKINDTYGHPLGDKILIHVVNLCKKCLRAYDYISRIGGEEFAVLLPHTDSDRAVAIANRIRKKIENSPYIHENSPVPCTISIGCFTNDNQIEEISQIYKQADEALYHAKDSGRNRVCVA